MSKKILELIPENLHEQLFKEVKEALISKGVKIVDPEDKKSKDEKINKEIEAWAKATSDNKSK